MGWGRVRSSFGRSAVHTDREFVLDCFQEGITEVANAEHLPRATARERQSVDQARNIEIVSPETSSRISRNTQDHIEVWTRLQVA